MFNFYLTSNLSGIHVIFRRMTPKHQNLILPFTNNCMSHFSFWRVKARMQVPTNYTVLFSMLMGPIRDLSSSCSTLKSGSYTSCHTVPLNCEQLQWSLKFGKNPIFLPAAWIILEYITEDRGRSHRVWFVVTNGTPDFPPSFFIKKITRINCFEMRHSCAVCALSRCISYKKPHFHSIPDILPLFFSLSLYWYSYTTHCPKGNRFSAIWHEM